MDKLIANASVGLAKAGMNRRGFLGRLARAAGGAAVLTAGLASVARADHCEGSHHCLTGCHTSPGTCGSGGCPMTETVTWWKCEVVDCYTREHCDWEYTFHSCGEPICPHGS